VFYVERVRGVLSLWIYASFWWLATAIFERYLVVGLIACPSIERWCCSPYTIISCRYLLPV